MKRLCLSLLVLLAGSQWTLADKEPDTGDRSQSKSATAPAADSSSTNSGDSSTEPAPEATGENSHDSDAKPSSAEPGTAEPAAAKPVDVDTLTGLELFSLIDSDDSETVTLTELFHVEGLGPKASLRQQFYVFDFDRDNFLSRAEFFTLPYLVPDTDRGVVADPIKSKLDGKVSRLTKSLAFPQKSDLTAKAWGDSLSPELRAHVLEWDRNSDGQVTEPEAQLSLEIAYGLRRPDGAAARRENGFVFNGSYLKHLDSNHDGRIAEDEFVPKYFAGAEQAAEIFQQADENGDHQLTLAETDAHSLLWVDVPGEFLGWDEDRDGWINTAELNAHAGSWQKSLAAHILPAFDIDGDGVLSLSEFQLSPLGNPLTDWHAQRVDSNHDGLLGFEEFFPKAPLPLSALASEFFTSFDLNHDGSLSLDEYGFEIDEQQIPIEQFVLLRDQNGDKRLSLVEAFSLQPSDAKETPAPRVPGHQQVFEQADADHDQQVTADELAGSPDLLSAMRAESHLKNAVQPAFQQQDGNQDHNLTLAEWLAGVAESETAERRQEFLVCDFDGSEALSLIEYACLPSVNPTQRRPAVADPVVAEVDRLQALLWKSGNSPDVAAVRSLQPYLTAIEIEHWDVNRDGTFQQSETRFGLETILAVRSPSGLLRRPTGQVFDMRTFRYADENHDGKLSREEFLKTYWKPQPKAIADFQTVDKNADAVLTLTEMLSSWVLWNDTQAEFRRFDADRSGSLSPAELTSQAREHERHAAEGLIPAFDADDNGRLSFVEFRLTPLANPVLDYNARRWDRNRDGQISLQEFHRERDRHYIGLSALLFSHFQQDQQDALQIDEYEFAGDIRYVPANAAFAMMDADKNNQLNLEEVVADAERRQPDWATETAHQRRMMQLEDAFHASDASGDGLVSADEYANKDSALALAIDGTGKAEAQQAAAEQAAATSDHRWRIIALVTINLVFLAGLGWWVLSPKRT